MLTACSEGPVPDPLRRARADGLNKEAFINRYRDPDTCLALSEEALRYIRDSLPDYVDGELRAYNNMAFAYFQKSDHANASLMLDRVDKTIGLHARTMCNGDIEWVIRQLIRARLLQRNCQIADSYRLLYDIGRSGILEDNSDNLLYNYAQTEYYITLLTLNFHYRDGKEADVRTLLAEVEQRREKLRVDYAQDMALNYALAYGWQSAGESLKALDYCDLNYAILDRIGHDLYHLANTLQMEAYALRSMPGETPPDTVLALYDEARRLFFDYGDPYQMLGGVTSTARYALLIGDTLRAHEVLAEWRALRGTWTPFAAPKMEESYFDVLIRSGIAESPAENCRWYEHRCELQEYIARNAEEDFALQNSLEQARNRSRQLVTFAWVLGALLLALLALTALLWRNALRLRREKRQLEEAKRRDVERIANVETCLSVMRHDISPFIGYLRNPNLPSDLRDEVLSQLLRAFDNIKNWTKLSIPSGLKFQPSTFALNEVFDSVEASCARLPERGVELIFHPSTLQVRGDRQLVEIMLRNLVNNALQHTLEGRVSVYAEAYPADNRFVHIEVDDTGTGMDAATLEDLFRADKKIRHNPDSTASYGSGFGLILCKYITKLHDDNTLRGCRIWAESTPGQGSTFHCLLAAKRSGSDPPPLAPSLQGGDGRR